MAILIRGKLYSSWKEAESSSSIFRSEIRTFDGRVSQSEDADFKLSAGRYRLIAGYGDPWSHRVLIVRALKQLEDIVPLTIIDPMMTKQGWVFSEQDRKKGEGIYSHKYLHELYRCSDLLFTGRISVPLLWDSKTERIVNNESYEITHMLNEAFSPLASGGLDLYPQGLASEIDHLSNFILNNINNGVYKVGFAPNQKVYKKSVDALFVALDDLEARLATSRYLVADQLTMADVCLFTTLLRFDLIYYPYLKCNYKRLQEYANLWGYTKDIYHLPGIAETVKTDSIMSTYYGLDYLNPSQVIPSPPNVCFGEAVEVMPYEVYSAPLS